MASQLPAFPRFVFTVVEPITILAGAIPAMLVPDWYIAEQIFHLPGSPLSNATAVVTESSRLVARQLGSAFGFVTLVALAVLYTTSEVKVVRNYLIALWVGDITHVASTFLALGYERWTALGAWNAMTWGNIGITTFLFLTRTAYLLGLFGSNKEPVNGQKSKIKKAQ